MRSAALGLSASATGSSPDARTLLSTSAADDDWVVVSTRMLLNASMLSLVLWIGIGLSLLG